MAINRNNIPAGGKNIPAGRITYDTNNTYTEVELDRENTITLTVQNNGRIRTEELFAYLDYLNLLQHVYKDNKNWTRAMKLQSKKKQTKKNSKEPSINNRS